LEASANGHDIETILLEEIIGEFSVVNAANAADPHLVSDRLLHFDREGSLIRRLGVWMLEWVIAT
jgi:hypothetical protein